MDKTNRVDRLGQPFHSYPGLQQERSDLENHGTRLGREGSHAKRLGVSDPVRRPP